MKRFSPKIRYDEWGDPWVEMVEASNGQWVSSEVAFPRIGYIWSFKHGTWANPKEMQKGDWYLRDGKAEEWKM